MRVGARVSRVGRSSLDFECTLLADNVEVATAETTCVLLDRATRKPPPISEEFRTYLTGT